MDYIYSELLSKINSTAKFIGRNSETAVVTVDDKLQIITVDVKPTLELDPDKNIYPQRGAGHNYILLSTIRADGSSSESWVEIDTLYDRVKDLENFQVVVSANLNNEINRAKEAERELEEQLSKEISNRESSDLDLQSNLNLERDRAEKAEESLNEKLDSEISRATATENSISANLNNEINRATQVEAAITEKLESLDYSEALQPSETIKSIKQVEGQIEITKQSIQIDLNQVTNLENELSNLKNRDEAIENLIPNETEEVPQKDSSTTIAVVRVEFDSENQKLKYITKAIRDVDIDDGDIDVDLNPNP